MNIEDLTKPQLLLLMLLVNFVTSVATGILTVSLLDQVPPVVTQTVNRIVEHTVQTVVPAQAAAVVKAVPAQAQPTTEDLTVAALAALQSRSVSVFSAKAGTTSPAIATGVYLPKSRAVATIGAALPAQAVIGFSDGSFDDVSLSHATDTVSVYGFADKVALPAAGVPQLVAPDTLKVGETVLALSKDGAALTGIVSKVDGDVVMTTLPPAPKGSAAVDLSGNIIGIANGDGSYESAALVLAALTATSTPSAVSAGS
ncbi:MAG: hypothetical protein KGI41_00095 [Patescibacteria group bacterium]|nr:hypothetical protein [Patescibacteria group bacterium]MDE1965636.1 hypothetical protein [Patescibacteria group bacterium]